MPAGNSGALASIYYYALKELCGFQNVRMYDGSWQEWANLAAYEPVTLDYVVNDDYATFPKYPAASPSIVFFSGKNNYFTYDPATDQFKDSQAATVVGNDKIKSGGSLSGNSRWDVITRSEFVIFRPKATLQSAAVTIGGKEYRNKSYNSAVDWPSVQTTPNYEGAANKIREEDEAYQGASGATGGSAPTPFVPKGGGC